MRHGLGEVHIAATANFQHGVASDYAFFQPCQRNYRLDRRARLKSGRESHFLIDDCQDAPGAGIHRQYRTVGMPQSVERDLADDRVVVLHFVAFTRISVTRGTAPMVRAGRGWRTERSSRRACEKQADYRYGLIKDWLAAHLDLYWPVAFLIRMQT